VALYGLSYLARGEAAFPPDLAPSFHSRPWGIFGHALGGSMALVTGILQVNRSSLRRSRAWHHRIGYVYLGAVLLTGVSGLYLAPYAFGGWITTAGFGSLAVWLLVSTAAAYRRILSRDFVRHRAWMLRSFAAVFAAVTLRIELPLLVAAFGGDFTPAYRIVAWLAWVPNLLWAEWWLARRSGTEVVAELLGCGETAG